jgi:hypothetical protein
MDHETCREWLDRSEDAARVGGGEPLSAAERSALDAHLAGCAACRAERDELARLADALAAARVAVRPGFAAAVLDAIEARGGAAWESRAPRGARAWRGPLALLGGLGAAAVAIGLVAAGPEPAAGGSVFAALYDLARAALLAGAGLAGATWSGVGAAVAEWLGDAPSRWVAAAVAVTGLNVLAVRLARRGAGAPLRSARRGAGATARRR